MKIWDITMIGHLSVDINKFKDKEMKDPGGGVFYASIPASLLKSKVFVLTKISKSDDDLFIDMEKAGVVVKKIYSNMSTNIENVYPTENPDSRISKVISKADSFKMEDLNFIEKSHIIHLTPLFFGEFPSELMPYVRDKADFLSVDAQGFLRHVENDGSMFYRDWEEKELCLKNIDILKVDIKEAKVVTGYENAEKALKELSKYELKEIILTQQDGIFLYLDGNIYFSKFGKWKMEGRTGRGDTCMGIYLSLREKYEPQKVLELTAIMATKKMNHKGPLNKNDIVTII